MSASPVSAKRSTSPVTTRRTSSSSLAIARGRKVRCTIRRSWSWRGLSMSGRKPGALMSFAVSSMSMPSKDRKVSASRAAARTSSNRESAQKSHFSLR